MRRCKALVSPTSPQSFCPGLNVKFTKGLLRFVCFVCSDSCADKPDVCLFVWSSCCSVPNFFQCLSPSGIVGILTILWHILPLTSCPLRGFCAVPAARLLLVGLMVIELRSALRFSNLAVPDYIGRESATRRVCLFVWVFSLFGALLRTCCFCLQRTFASWFYCDRIQIRIEI